MEIRGPDFNRDARRVHRKGTYILSAAVALVAFIIVYAYGGDTKLYYAIAAAGVMAAVIYLANHLQFHRKYNR